MATTTVSRPAPKRDELAAQLEQGVQARRESDRLLDSFLLALDAAGLSPATLRLYGFGLRKLYAFLDHIGLDAPLSGISAEHLREWLRAERQAGAAPATLDALHRAMRRFWRFLAEEGEVAENVAAKVPAPKQDVKVVEALTPEQVAALFKVCRKDRSIQASETRRSSRFCWIPAYARLSSCR